MRLTFLGLTTTMPEIFRTFPSQDPQAMENQSRLYIYAFLSRMFADILSEREIHDLKKSANLLNLLSPETARWFAQESKKKLLEQLNTDYTSLFVMNSQPIESSVLDGKDEVLVGLQNPVMQFYFLNGYEINMNQTQILAPDHLAIEFGFMQNLVQKGEKEVQFDFLKKHLMQWAPLYLLGIKRMAETFFYRDLCDFTAEFIVSEYDALAKEFGDGKR